MTGGPAYWVCFSVRLVRYVVLFSEYVAFIALGAFIVYIIRLRREGQLTEYEDDVCRQKETNITSTASSSSCMFCSRNTLNLGSVVFWFHVLYGLTTLGFWIKMRRLSVRKLRSSGIFCRSGSIHL